MDGLGIRVMDREYAEMLVRMVNSYQAVRRGLEFTMVRSIVGLHHAIPIPRPNSQRTNIALMVGRLCPCISG